MRHRPHSLSRRCRASGRGRRSPPLAGARRGGPAVVWGSWGLPRERQAPLLAALGDGDAAALVDDWRFWARAAQLPPEGEWRVWLLLAGRGFGKTRSGAEWVRHR